MKNKLVAVMLVLSLIASFALAQINDASMVYDDATQGRLRVAHFVFNGPDVDLLVNGEVAVITDRALAKIPCCEIAPYLYLEPGTYSLAVVPTGKDVEQAILGPLDVEVAAGHRYMVAMMGQVDDESLTSLVIDETAVLKEARTDPSQQLLMMINNVAGTTTIDFNAEGSGPHNVEYGGFDITDGGVAFGNCEAFIIAFDDTTIVSEPASSECDPAVPADPVEPGMDFMVAFMGRFPGAEREDRGETQGPNFSDLNAREFLEQFSGLGYEQNGLAFSFNTFLAAMEKAGLGDLLTTGGPYAMFVPVDDAFAALPDGQLDALMADPEALAKLLRYHIAPGYYPVGTLNNGKTWSGLDRTITNMVGADLKLLIENDVFTVNEVVEVDVQSYFVPSGTRLWPMSKVLTPPAE